MYPKCYRILFCVHILYINVIIQNFMHVFFLNSMVAYYSVDGHFMIYLLNLLMTTILVVFSFATRSTTLVFANSSLASCLLSPQINPRNGIDTLNQMCIQKDGTNFHPPTKACNHIRFSTFGNGISSIFNL